MANPLVEKLRNGRQFQHAVDGHTYILRRPGDPQLPGRARLDRRAPGQGQGRRKKLIDWLEGCRLPLPPVAPPDGVSLAVDMWNYMKGLEWQALPIVFEKFGIQDEDAEMMLDRLVTMRDFQNRDD